MGGRRISKLRGNREFGGRCDQHGEEFARPNGRSTQRLFVAHLSDNSEVKLAPTKDHNLFPCAEYSFDVHLIIFVPHVTLLLIFSVATPLRRIPMVKLFFV